MNLLSHVDNDSAEIFMADVTFALGDMDTISTRYHAGLVRTWLGSYWISQINAIGLDTTHVSHALLYGGNNETFISIFTTSVLPMIMEVGLSPMQMPLPMEVRHEQASC